MKDQPTEASMNTFHVDRLRLPSAPFNRGQDLEPITAEQGELPIKGEVRCCVFSRRVNWQNQNETTLGVSHLPCASQTGFKQAGGVQTSVRIASVRRVEDETGDMPDPILRENIGQARCITTFDRGVVGVLPSVRPSKIGAGALHHFGMDVDTDGLSPAEGGLDEEPAGSRHGVHHATSFDRSSCQVNGETRQHRVEADRFEERPFSCPPFAVGKSRLSVTLHPTRGQ